MWGGPWGLQRVSGEAQWMEINKYYISFQMEVTLRQEDSSETKLFRDKCIGVPIFPDILMFLLYVKLSCLMLNAHGINTHHSGPIGTQEYTQINQSKGGAFPNLSQKGKPPAQPWKIHVLLHSFLTWLTINNCRHFLWCYYSNWLPVMKNDKHTLTGWTEGVLDRNTHLWTWWK